MKIKQLVVGPLESNCYLVWDPTTASQPDGQVQGVVIDPGAEGGFISEQILAEKVTLKAILLTHGHFDHVLGVLEVKLNFGVPIMLSHDDEALYLKASKSSEYWTKLPADPVMPLDEYIEEGKIISFGRCRLQVLETPGHTPGSVCFYEEKEKMLFSGDLIFADGIGRTDFSYSNRKKMSESLKRIRALPGGVEVYSGHGGMFYL